MQYFFEMACWIGKSLPHDSLTSLQPQKGLRNEYRETRTNKKSLRKHTKQSRTLTGKSTRPLRGQKPSRSYDLTNKI